MHPKVGIVILNYKNYEDTIECLRSLDKVTYLNKEIFVVDNASQNDSLKYIQSDLLIRNINHAFIDGNEFNHDQPVDCKIYLFQSLDNRGYAAGNNYGIRLAMMRNAEYILILNNDTEVKIDFLEYLIEYADKHPEIGAVGPKVLDINGNIDLTCARRKRTPLSYFFCIGIGSKIFPNNRYLLRHSYQGEYFFDLPKEVDVLSGCCMMIKSRVFERIGLFDENTFLYLEEFIIYEKLNNIVMISFVVPNSVILHKKGKSKNKISSDIINTIAKKSLRYYLREYKNYGKIVTEIILLSTSNPVGLMLSKYNKIGKMASE